MAMLAEPKRKQKFSNDPRNLKWANDDEKFGQKMLEKMGWEKGKGLGAKLHGNTETVAQTLKNDNRGVGCSKSHADNWIAHQDDFNALLSQLNTSQDSGGENSDIAKVQDDTEVISLESKSKTSRGRVHYQKFTRGKDLSGYKKDDMDCIFGKRKSKSAPSTPQTQSEANSDADDKQSGDEDKQDVISGLNTVTSSTSIAEYFAQKMAKLKNSGLSFSNNSNSGSNSCDKDSQSDEEIVRFGLGQDDSNHSESNNRSEEPVSKKEKKKAKKSKSRAQLEEKEEVVDACHMPIAEGNVDEGPVKRKKEKKSKKEKLQAPVGDEIVQDTTVHDTASLDNKSGCTTKQPLQTPNTVKCQEEAQSESSKALLPLEENGKKTKKEKKKSRKRVANGTSETVSLENVADLETAEKKRESVDDTQTTSDKPSKEKKKSRKRKQEETSESLEATNEDKASVELSVKKPKVERKSTSVEDPGLMIHVTKALDGQHPKKTKKKKVPTATLR